MHPKARIHADPSLNADQFDRLPDSVVLFIFNKLADVRSLGRCSTVSKRFNSLVPLVHDIYVKIDRVVTVDGDAEDALNPPNPRPRNLFSHFFKMMFFTLLKPFHNLRNINGGNKPLFPQLAHHSPAQVLKNFTHVRHLRIELPAGDVGTEEGVVLKWKAEFGSTLQNCVILGGTRMDRKYITEQEQSIEDNESIPESFYTNGGLKLRVVWTISSLIAASTRHYLLRTIIKDHPTLWSLVLTDADGQGTLLMGVEQLKEFRENQVAASEPSSNRTLIPASSMKLRYSPYLELPDTMGLQGATLVAIKPSHEGGSGTYSSKKEIDTFVSGAFDGPFKIAVKALMKRRTYLLEMNGF
ncbi:F-box protein At4g18380-like [Typha latifolia]|uniref:F-box protein At4g18380-like n=1 Tax=Typha latifolia TaxID=4733 RepID=UPI003C2D09C5